MIPIALKYASIADGNGDGLAEKVIVDFASAVDARHAPDSLSVIFGSAIPETLWTSALTWNTDRTEAELGLSKPFSLGNTNGNYSGLSYKGGQLVGAGLVVQHKGSGANYESDSTLAEDLTGPVIVEASAKSTGTVITLLAIPSEPLLVNDSTLTLIQRERKGPIAVKASNWKNGTASFTLIYSKDEESAVMEGDRIRFAPLDASLFIDKNGNLPSLQNPWATVTGTGTPSIDFSFNPINPVMDVSQSTSAEEIPSSGADYRLFVLNQNTSNWDIFENGLFVTSIDTASYNFSGAVFELHMGVPRGTSYTEAPAWDSLTVAYDIPFYSNLGSYVNRFKGNFTVTSKYLSSDNQVQMRFEWLSHGTKGIVAENGKALGTGAYIAKAGIKTRFFVNKDQTTEIKTRFTSKDHCNITRTFGIQRIR